MAPSCGGWCSGSWAMGCFGGGGVWAGAGAAPAGRCAAVRLEAACAPRPGLTATTPGWAARPGLCTACGAAALPPGAALAAALIPGRCCRLGLGAATPETCAACAVCAALMLGAGLAAVPDTASVADAVPPALRPFEAVTPKKDVNFCCPGSGSAGCLRFPPICPVSGSQLMAFVYVSQGHLSFHVTWFRSANLSVRIQILVSSSHHQLADELHARKKGLRLFCK